MYIWSVEKGDVDSVIIPQLTQLTRQIQHAKENVSVFIKIMESWLQLKLKTYWLFTDFNSIANNYNSTVMGLVLTFQSPTQSPNCSAKLINIYHWWYQGICFISCISQQRGIISCVCIPWWVQQGMSADQFLVNWCV